MDSLSGSGSIEKDKERILLFNYKLSRIRRASLEKDFSRFRRHYFPSYHKLEDAPFHNELSSLLFDMTRKRGMKLAIAAPRGSAKSTIVTLEYVIYSICYKLEDFILIISSTNDVATGFLSDIKKELESNDRLLKDFPNVCEIYKKPGPPRWTQQEIITRNQVKVLALGMGQQIRGRHHKESRPSLIVLDDIEADDNTREPYRYYKLHNWLNRSVLKAGTARTNVICIGTIHHDKSFLAELTSPSSNGWVKKVYHSVISWSKHSELWQTWTDIFTRIEKYEDETGKEAAKRFFEANKEAMLEATEVLWPANKSYYDLMVMREEEGYDSFDSEMQNDPTSVSEFYFNLEKMHFWNDRFSSEEELIKTLGDNAYFYGACDPSMGKRGLRGDYSAIVTVVQDNDTRIIYVLDADIKRRLPDRIIDDILAYHKKRYYDEFVYDPNQLKEFIVEKLKKRCTSQGLELRMYPAKQTTNRFSRIEALQPMVKTGEIQFSRKHSVLLDQMKLFPKGRHGDGLDALEMVVQLCLQESKIQPFVVMGYNDTGEKVELFRDEGRARHPKRKEAVHH